MYNKPSISDYYRKLAEDIRGEILRESEEQIIGSNIEELSKYYFDKYALLVIEIDETQEANWSQENYVKTIPAHQREEGYREEGDKDWLCERVTVEIPIKPNEKMSIISQLESSTFSFSFTGDEFDWGQNRVSFVVETKGYVFNYDENKIVQEVNSGIDRVKQIIGWKNNDINKENQSLLSHIKKLIEDKKREIEVNKQKISLLTKKINIPLKKKESLLGQRVNIEQRPIVKRIKPSPQLPEEYVLDEDKVNDIIEIIDNQADAFEKTPATFKNLGEEDLRNLICANLNSIFAGNATAETFSKKGKTDIYLNIKKGNILIFECKFWAGKQSYLAAINQLRGYLTWRQNYGVMINFVKIKNFTQVLNQIQSIVEESDSYARGFNKIRDTRFVSYHNLEDEDKQVKIIHLFYNLYFD